MKESKQITMEEYLHKLEEGKKVYLNGKGEVLPWEEKSKVSKYKNRLVLKIYR